ncbi:MAG TPA: NADH-quinone oxidoreductase subunit J [Aggregatilineaceae bacterium]|nr:NADH-quinone oxidoreductase subunit J [Aggregatilineaceae bacterium]
MELTLFIIVGAIAVATAAMMLISENAVHSALFLIVNFGCIAFFFLMLHAPFLAMVQITVYAGAIMVLFLFVIMLLGAERLLPEKEARFPWLSPAAVFLALVFLVVTSLTILRGEIDLTEPEETISQVRVVNTLENTENVDVYLGDERIASDLSYRETTDYQDWAVGRYESLTVRAAGGDDVLYTHDRPVDLTGGDAIVLVLVRSSDGIELVTGTENLSGIDDRESMRVMAINGFHDQAAIDVYDTSEGRDKLLIENLAYREASKGVVVGVQDDMELAVTPHGSKAQILTVNSDDLDFARDESLLLVLTDRQQPDNSWQNVVIDLQSDVEPSFGSPRHVGQLLFSRYVLPFEMVALVLLVAMIGAIVLTHETLGRRQRRIVRRLANPPVGLDQPIVGNPANPVSRGE